MSSLATRPNHQRRLKPSVRPDLPSATGHATTPRQNFGMKKKHPKKGFDQFFKQIFVPILGQPMYCFAAKPICRVKVVLAMHFCILRKIQFLVEGVWSDIHTCQNFVFFRKFIHLSVLLLFCVFFSYIPQF